MTFEYTVVIEAEPEGGFHAYVPALRGCRSDGETEAEAWTNIREAVQLYVESLQAHGEAVPQENLRVRSLAVAV